MISLTYLSRATTPLDPGRLTELLRASRDANAARDLTGMLLYVDGQFIQTLEGPAGPVTATMDRISADPRHHSIDVTLVEDVAHRSFEGWTMGFTVLSPEEVRALPGFTDFLEPDSPRYRGAASLGRAGKFHRAFRDALA